jgi:hypothetical protein
VRATGLKSAPGTLIHAAKALPALRVNALHLGPFTAYDHQCIYIPNALRTIAPNIVDRSLPLSAEDQLRALVQAAHLLGMAVGFDLEPHVAQFGIPVLMNPDLFRWIRLTPDRTALTGGLTQAQMMAEPEQARIAAAVRAIVARGLESAGLHDLEAVEGEPISAVKQKRATYHSLIVALIRQGYWTLPVQSWAGQGVPAFSGYNHQGNFATFDYRGANGEDLSESAYHVLTPVKFSTGQMPNRAPDHAEPYPPGIEFFAQIAGYWRDRFGFDFIRYDSVDHIVDSVRQGMPLSDRPTPDGLRTAIERSRTPAKPHIGNLAERMGEEVEDYAAMGFDVMLGADMLHHVDRRAVESAFALNDRLTALNAGRDRRHSVTWAIDTHDTGNPGIWGEPLVKIAGFEGMRRRHFVSRFISAGAARRPKYEALGSQDLSYGLFEANIRDVNLTWAGDEAFNRHYHRLEDLYARYRDWIARGWIVRRYAAEDCAWWVIQDGTRALIAALTFHLPARDFDIHLDGLVIAADGVIHDFETDDPTPVHLTEPRLRLTFGGLRLIALGA